MSAIPSKLDHDVLMVWSVDRLGRSTAAVTGALEELHGAGVDVFVDRQAVDTTTPHGKAMFQMAAVFGELERSLIRERVMAGLARARARGKRLGRPDGWEEGGRGHTSSPCSWAGHSEGRKGAWGRREHCPATKGKPPRSTGLIQLWGPHGDGS
jgi:hypothetical protein